MADIQRTIVAKLRLDEEGDAELFGKTTEEIAEMQKATSAAGTAAEGLGKSFEQGTRAVESGSTRATAAVEKIGVALANYRQRIKEAEAAGATIGDEQIAELQRLEKEYDKAVESVGRLRTAQQQAKRDIDDATEAAGGQVERINSLDDIVRKLAEDMGPAGVKALTWGAAIAGGAKAGWEAGEKLREVLNSLTDGGFDKDIQRNLFAWVKLEGALDSATAQAQELKNELNILAKNGIDVAGLSADEVHAKFRDFTGGLLENNAAVNEAEESYRKFRAAIGPVGSELDKLADTLIKNIQRLAKENPDLGIEEIVRRTGPMIEELLAKYGHLETEGKKRLQGLLQQWRELAPGIDAEVKQIGKSVDDLAAAIQKMPNVGEIFGKIDNGKADGAKEKIDKIAASVDNLAQAWERGRPAIDLTTGAIEGGAAGLKFYNEELERSVAAAAAVTAACERLRSIIDGVGYSAKLAAGEVRGVFLGTPQIGGSGMGVNPFADGEQLSD